MDTNNVIWQEGLFLRPQHFQQQERFLLNWVEQRCRPLRAYNWGFTELKIDVESLGLGKLVLLSCKGIFPDGTPFDAPTKDPLPLPLDVATEVKDCRVYLSLALEQQGISPVLNYNEINTLARYELKEIQVKDLCTPGLNETAEIQVGSLRMSLVTQQDNTRAFALIPLAQVLEKTSDNLVRLSPSFISSNLYCQASQQLPAYIRELCGLLKQRGDSLASDLANPSISGVAEVSNFLQLQLINRYEVLFFHLEKVSELHPEELYRLLLMLAGELATFTRDERRTIALDAYYHHDLELSFKPLMLEIRRAFSTITIKKALRLEIIEHNKYGIWVGKIPDKSLLTTADFILASKAKLAPEKIRQSFPKQTTVSTVEKIASLVNSLLPGIDLYPMPVAPPQIPYHVGFTYFQINTQDPNWKLLENSGGLAVHIGTNYPDLELELWAIRS